VQAWSRGTVVRSWLLDLMVKALADDPKLAMLDDWVDDSGEGRWTVDEGIDLAVPLPVISAALFARFASRQEQSPAMKAVAALRQHFGGYAMKIVEWLRWNVRSLVDVHLPPLTARVPVVSDRRPRDGAGCESLRRAERPRQDDPRRSNRLR